MPAPIVKGAEQDKREELRKLKPYVYDKIMKYEEKIKNGESIAILQFQYDYTCNFSCEHCCITRLRGKNPDRIFTPADVAELARQADEMGLAHLVITGGEPLVFPDLDEIVKAINPQKFYLSCDTNGWHLDEAKARHLKEIGIDKIQLSLDSLNSAEHDAFRRKDGSQARCLRAIEAAQKAGLNIIVQTVVWKKRVRSQEFVDFLKFLNSKGVGVFITYAKPVGAWEGKFDEMIDRSDMDYVRELEKKYNVFTHLTPSYGLDLGCIGVSRMVSVTKYGDIMPCPYIHVSLGNFFEEPLRDIIERGLNTRHFGQYCDTCWIAEDKKFVKEYVATRIYGKKLPVHFNDFFKKEDLIEKKERKLFR